MERIIMWYAIFGLATCIFGMVREYRGKTLGNADEITVLACILVWPIFLPFMLYSYVNPIWKWLKKLFN